MTRANIEIIQDAFPKRTFLEVGGDGYPSNILEPMVKFLTGHIWKWAIANEKEVIHYQRIQKCEYVDLVTNLCAAPSGVANFSYSYQIDLVKGKIIVWDSKMRWFYAPKNWKERGWVCNETKNDRAGYTSWVKGKRLYEINLTDIIANKGVKIEDKWLEFDLEEE